MAISHAAQFGLLLWKHWLVQKRRIILTLLFVFLPAILAIQLLVSRLLLKSQSVSQPTIWNSFNVSALPQNLTQRAAVIPALPANGFVAGKWTLVFSPNTSKVATTIATETAKTLNMTLFPIGN